MFDPEKFGAAMGEAIRAAVAPLQKEIADLRKQLADRPDPAPMIAECVERAVAALPPAAAGASVTLADVQPLLDQAIKDLHETAAKTIDCAIRDIPVPKDGRDGVDGKDGHDGEKGADGLGVSDLLIDRDGNLVATMTDGRMKSLGVIVGKDGANGADGKDGLSLESFDLEYIEETHEIAIKASAAGRSKELRYPAGGIRPAGYWREGTKAKAGEAWVQGGSLWIAMKATDTKPATGDAWIIAARAGRDGERGQKGADAEPPKPISLGGKQ